MDGYVKYCPVCSKLFEYEKSRSTLCDFCGHNLVESSITNDEQYHRAVEQIIEWRKETIEANPLYDKDAHERLKRHTLMQDQIKFGSFPHCPKCGSASFQMVPKRWNLLTGFFTNKVDRVCERCKARF